MTPYFFISFQQHFEFANYFSLIFFMFLAMLLAAVAICKIGQHIDIVAPEAWRAVP